MEVNEEITKIILHISKNLAPTFTFGFHTVEDMRQQGFVFGLEALQKFDESKITDEETGHTLLYQFLYRAMTNKYLNFVRNNYCRATEGSNPNIRKIRKKIVDLDILDRPSAIVDRVAVSHEEEVEYYDLLDCIEKNMDRKTLHDFKRMLDGAKISGARRKRVREIIRSILDE